uniref:Neur_chan_LBD domain-containing protein n=1 Tax=Heterorhabditis bacteriophora TaxID=37862 RepID=A0A1I7XMR4_HETBA
MSICLTSYSEERSKDSTILVLTQCQQKQLINYLFNDYRKELSANMNIRENELQTNVLIENTGRISLFRAIITDVTCDLRLERFPFDQNQSRFIKPLYTKYGVEAGGFQIQKFSIISSPYNFYIYYFILYFQVSLGVTALLSLAIILMMVSDKLPATSNSVPLLGKPKDIYYVLCNLLGLGISHINMITINPKYMYLL